MATCPPCGPTAMRKNAPLPGEKQPIRARTVSALSIKLMYAAAVLMTEKHPNITGNLFFSAVVTKNFGLFTEGNGNLLTEVF